MIERFQYPLISVRGANRTIIGLQRAGKKAPNLWQVQLGTAKMVHRLLFNNQTVGLSKRFSPRRNIRAKLLSYRPLRFPFLIKEGSITPWDMTGFCSSPDTIVNHLLTAHHDGVQFVYDFQLLELHPGRLEEVERLAQTIVDDSHPKAQWYKDLTVFENYHEELLNAVKAFRRGELEMSEADATNPDVSLYPFIDWLCELPESPEDTPAFLLKQVFRS